MIKQIVYLAVFVLYASIATAQNAGSQFVFKKFDKGSGLPSNTVYDVYTASDGLIWFATDKGVCSFDGRYFRTYTTFHGLPDNEIFFFREDKQRRLWLGCYNGELCYFKDGAFFSKKNKAFLNVNNVKSSPRFINSNDDGSVTFLFRNNKEFILINGEEAKLYNLDPHLAGLEIGTIFSAERTRQNGLHIKTEFGEYEFDKELNLKNSRFFNGEKSLQGFTYTGGVWNYLTRKEILDEKYRYIRPNPLPADLSRRVRKIVFYKSRCVIGGDFGLRGDLISQSGNVSSLCEDAYGHLWVGTLDSGARCMDMSISSRTADALSDNDYIVGACKRDSTAVVISHQGAVCEIGGDLNTREIFRLRHKSLTSLNSVISLDSGSVIRIAVFERAKLHLYFLKNDKTTHDEKYIGENLITKQLFFLGPRVYIRYPDRLGIVQFDKQRHYYKTIQNTTNESVKGQWFISGAVSGNKYIYSTVLGLFAGSAGADTFIRQRNLPALRWIAVRGSYLMGARQENLLCVASLSQPTQQWNFFQDCIWEGAVALSNSEFLVQTSASYRLLDMSALHTGGTPKIRILDNAFLPQNLSNGIRLKNSMLAFEGRNISCVPDTILLRRAAYRPSVLVENIVIDGKRSTIDYQSAGNIYVSYKASRRILLGFRSVAPAGTNSTLEYSLERVSNRAWIPLANGELTLVDPPAGAMKIFVRARTDGEEISAIRELTLDIETPFWMRRWFLALATIIALAVIILVFRVYLLLQSKRHQRHVRYLRSEFKATNALMNPHFVFNCLNTIQALVNMGRTSDASLYVAEFSKLARKNLQLAKDDLVPLDEELDLVKQYVGFEKLRFEKGINLEIEIEPGLVLDDILVPPLSLQPLVENSIIHGLLPKRESPGNIWIKITSRNERVSIVVEDDGVGLPAEGVEQKINGRLGIHAVASRFAKLRAFRNADYSFKIVSKGQGKGTIAEILLPGSYAKD